jgi:hypothetical protein
MRLFMKFRQTETVAVAAAKASFSAATAYRIEQDPRLPSAKTETRERRRPDPLGAIFEQEVAPRMARPVRAGATGSISAGSENPSAILGLLRPDADPNPQAPPPLREQFGNRPDAWQGLRGKAALPGAMALMPLLLRRPFHSGGPESRFAPSSTAAGACKRSAWPACFFFRSAEGRPRASKPDRKGIGMANRHLSPS